MPNHVDRQLHSRSRASRLRDSAPPGRRQYGRGSAGSAAEVSCIVATARGAVWGEHVAGIGVAADGTLQLLTRQGHSHPLPSSYAGDRVAEVCAALLAAIDTAVRSAVRDSRLTTVIVLDADLVLHLNEYHAVTWTPHRRTRVFTVCHVAAGQEQPDQTDDQKPPDPDENDPDAPRQAEPL